MILDINQTTGNFGTLSFKQNFDCLVVWLLNLGQVFSSFLTGSFGLLAEIQDARLYGQESITSTFSRGQPFGIRCFTSRVFGLQLADVERQEKLSKTNQESHKGGECLVVIQKHSSGNKQ
jgi:hypothetical protein